MLEHGISLNLCQPFEEVSKGLRLTGDSIQPNPFQIAYGALLCSLHTHTHIQFASLHLYVDLHSDCSRGCIANHEGEQMQIQAESW